MSAQTISPSEPVAPGIIRAHPLHSITAAEITQASTIIRKLVEEADLTGKLRFKNISQTEPPKALLLPYLDAEAAGVPVNERSFVPRCVDVIWAINNERDVFETTVSLDTNTTVSQSKALPGQHSSLDRDEIRGAAIKVLNDPMVLDAIKKLKLPTDVVVQADTWM